MPDGGANLGDGQRSPAQECLEIKASAPEARRIVVDEVRFLGPQWLDVVEVGEERRFLVPDQLGEAKCANQVPIGLGLLDAGNQPVFVADLDSSTGSEERDGG